MQLVKLQPGTRIQTLVWQRWDSAENWLIPTRDREYPACEWDASLLAVLIPGFGVCRVPKGEAEELDPSAHDASQFWWQSQPPEKPIEVLRIDTSEDDANIPRFLELVCVRALRVLEIDSAQPLLDEDLARICRACPSLERLSIVNGDLSALLGLFRSGGFAVLRSLSLKWVEMKKEDLVAFVDELADTSSPTSQSLEEFEYIVDTQREKWVEMEEDVATAVLRMLQVNRRLSMLRISLTASRQQQRELLSKHHGELTNKRMEVLSMRSKVALLSVVEHFGGERRSAIGSLDSLCMVHIFSFFGRRRRRCVLVD
ncbi:hypothetical protein PINS_up010361 [Pythium insidiosum]|nr:hypothetical protein PINS_up010361 [Pythium insidiosum]